MPSDLLTPFLELDEEFCKTSCSPELSDGGFQRRHSLCPLTVPTSKVEAEEAACWGLSVALQQRWRRELPRSALSHIPFRVDRSVSMIEGGAAKGKMAAASPPPPPLLPPPGLCLGGAALSPASRLPAPPAHISTRYKTELCRTFEEIGACKYGAKCQFAHGVEELRGLSRHPKYKTEPCRTFHTIGFCPYGARCHFIHNADEVQAGAPPLGPRPPLLRHSLSFAGFSSSPHSFQPAEESWPSSLLFSRASSVSPPSSSGSPELPSPSLPEPRALQHCPCRITGVGHLDHGDSTLRFFAATDPAGTRCPPPAKPALRPPRRPAAPLSARPALQRCSSADSLSEEGYTSSCSLSSASSGAESPGLEGRRLPIFSRLSITDE